MGPSDRTLISNKNSVLSETRAKKGILLVGFLIVLCLYPLLPSLFSSQPIMATRADPVEPVEFTNSDGAFTYNNQSVFCKLYEPIKGESKYSNRKTKDM